MLNKKCKKCGLYSIKKNWTRDWKQRYKCNKCWYVFENKSRKKLKKLRIDYTEWKQTYNQLSEKYWIHRNTVKNRLDKVNVKVKKTMI